MSRTPSRLAIASPRRNEDRVRDLISNDDSKRVTRMVELTASPVAWCCKGDPRIASAGHRYLTEQERADAAPRRSLVKPNATLCK